MLCLNEWIGIYDTVHSMFYLLLQNMGGYDSVS